MFIKVHVTLPHPSLFLSHCKVHQNSYCNDGCHMWHSLMASSDCDVHQCLCHIATFINDYVTLQHSSMAMSHCDNH